MLRVKPGVQFTTIAPAGFRILSALEQTSRELQRDLTITSACDGVHSGPTDPHARGEAYDVRVSDQPEPVRLLRSVMLHLSNGSELDAPLETSGGLATGWFFGQIEDPAGPNRHLHIQLRKGRVYA